MDTAYYDKIKKWCGGHQKEITVGACFALVFLVGFGTGRYDRQAQSLKRKTQNNYSKTSDNQQKAAEDAGANQNRPGEGQVAGQATAGGGGAAGKNQATDKSNCPIKGNISAKGGKIYHVKGGAFYDRTNPEQCFSTESEAKAAGFRKSSR